ncbi:HlyD family type I secretion periplasmic adaptor subunit [Salmonella enterica]|uniref:Membrane fusion protein (MFP) family protein n=1 Tax=Salmonella enterica I TaxID=59201 RepID=A0A403QJ69_SALET|nr:HlyD family type I secretion periplasmic adaptor subunit [Salmonella enterica]EAS0615378.1 HlyD family type I secretion periplasmic adaptor subunit [Salmonella enterica subsp. enterica serovar Dahomey]EBQ9004936.1 hypothetical protein [Salmonella enterica subsp. enterica serovar Blockley]EBS0793151.1 HlyD family type I secretion periplasmic adaptor subunit [Salmonella enterica subsp. enterica serovar Overschie]EBZ5137400.1 HlyD family type I secretion periplasmic adaptor subunit [Salmonella 
MKILLKLSLLKPKLNDTLYLIIAVTSLSIFLFIIFFMKVDIVVHGRGYLQIKDKNILIEHPDGGRIKELLVREGSVVKEGQLLAVIDNSYIAEEVAKAVQQKKSYSIRIERIEAEINNTPFVIPAKISNKEKEYYSYEKAIYDSEMNNLKNELTTSESVEKQRKAEYESNQIKIQGLKKDLEYAYKQEKMVRDLVKIKAAAKGTLIEKEADLQKIRNELNLAESMTSVLQSGIETSVLDTNEIKSKFKKEKNNEILKLQEAITEIDAKLVGINARRKQSNIYSPVPGRIQKMFKPNEGSVLPAGGALFEITPDNVPVIAVVRLDTKDRDKVWSGMNVKIDIGGTGGTRTEPVSGQVKVVSADSLNDEHGNRYYQAEIILTGGKQKNLFPGMAVDAYILTGKRSIADYFFSPIIKGMKRSFSEQ